MEGCQLLINVVCHWPSYDRQRSDAGVSVHQGAWWQRKLSLSPSSEKMTPLGVECCQQGGLMTVWSVMLESLSTRVPDDRESCVLCKQSCQRQPCSGAGYCKAILSLSRRWYDDGFWVSYCKIMLSLSRRWCDDNIEFLNWKLKLSPSTKWSEDSIGISYGKIMLSTRHGDDSIGVSCCVVMLWS